MITNIIITRMFGVVRSILNIIFGIIELLLVIRFLFQLLSANSGTPFVAWIYSVTGGLVAPFAGIAPPLHMGRFVLDFTTLIALIVYSLVGYFLLQLFYYSEDRYYYRP